MPPVLFFIGCWVCISEERSAPGTGYEGQDGSPRVGALGGRGALVGGTDQMPASQTSWRHSGQAYAIRMSPSNET